MAKKAKSGVTLYKKVTTKTGVAFQKVNVSCSKKTATKKRTATKTKRK